MVGEPLLRRGSTGDFVRRLQRALASVGFDPGPIDAIFGPLTDAAVRSFQTARALQVDGIVGPQTWGALPKSVVRLHIKVMVNPTSHTIDDMVRNMRDTYISARVGVEVASTEVLPLNTALQDLDVGNCPFPCPTTPTAEQAQLFAHNANVGANEVVAYFVDSVITAGGGVLNGCCAHPVRQPGVAVASTPSQWTLAHEIGHVLGLPHADAVGACLFDRLMTSCSTNNITNPPPDLDPSEIAIMDASPLTIDL
jgi:hypothetical protein